MPCCDWPALDFSCCVLELPSAAILGGATERSSDDTSPTLGASFSVNGSRLVDRKWLPAIVAIYVDLFLICHFSMSFRFPYARWKWATYRHDTATMPNRLMAARVRVVGSDKFTTHASTSPSGLNPIPVITCPSAEMSFAVDSAHLRNDFHSSGDHLSSFNNFGTLPGNVADSASE